MNLIAYMAFGGNCEEAMNFYKSVLGGEVTMLMRFGEAPDDVAVSDAYKDKIMHAQLEFEGNILYMSDTWEGQRVSTDGNISLNINFDSEKGLEDVYNALKEKGQVTMELQDTFWGAKYGSVIDQFGTNWSLNYGQSE